MVLTSDDFTFEGSGWVGVENWLVGGIGRDVDVDVGGVGDGGGDTFLKFCNIFFFESIHVFVVIQNFVERHYI